MNRRAQFMMERWLCWLVRGLTLQLGRLVIEQPWAQACFVVLWWMWIMNGVVLAFLSATGGWWDV